jgi:hypothetical protein
MPRRPDPRVLDARLDGAAKAIRGAVWQADPETMTRQRAEWPRLWEGIDRLLEDVDAQYPPFGGSGTS